MRAQTIIIIAVIIGYIVAVNMVVKAGKRVLNKLDAQQEA